MVSPRQPAGLLDLAQQAVRAYIRTWTTIASWGEEQVFGFLRSGIDNGAKPTPAALPPAPPTPQPAEPENLGTKMRDLLGRAIGQNTAASRQELFHKILDQLVPDEARIISALSDGSASPLLNIYARTRARPLGEPVLENMSLIGKTANLALPQLTPMYVSHLLSLGVVECGPEDSSMKDEYEILAADLTVLQAIKSASRGPIPAQPEKYALRLSALGRELWAATSAPEVRS